MKNILFLFALICLHVGAFAQTAVPQLVNFQAIARDQSGNIIANQPISIRLTVREGSATGTGVYCALHQEVTNQYGSFSIQLNRNTLGIACNSTPATAFENIQWESGSKWIQVEYQPIPASPFVDLGAIELTSVFYAFMARKAEEVANISSAGAQQGNVLTYDMATNKWIPGTVSGGGGGNTISAGAGISVNTSGGNTTITNTGDLSSANELQTLSVSGNQLTISNGNSVVLPSGGGTTYSAGAGINISGSTISATDASATNEIQSLSLAGNTLTLSGANSVTLPGGGSGNAVYAKYVATSFQNFSTMNAWVATNISVTVPQTGTYMVSSTARGGNGVSQGWIKYRVQNITSSQTIGVAFIGFPALVTTSLYNSDATGAHNTVVYLTQGDILRIDAWCNSVAGTTIWNLGGDVNGESTLTIVQIGN